MNKEKLQLKYILALIEQEVIAKKYNDNTRVEIELKPILSLGITYDWYKDNLNCIKNILINSQLEVVDYMMYPQDEPFYEGYSCYFWLEW